MTITPAELADDLRMSPEWVRDRANRREFPHLRVGRYIRFTDEHVAQIKEQLEQEAAPKTPVYGLTSRSRRRRTH